MRGNMIGRYLALTLLIKQLKSSRQYAITGFHTICNNLIFDVMNVSYCKRSCQLCHQPLTY